MRDCRFSLAAGLALMAAACGDSEATSGALTPDGGPDPCAGMTCSGHGVCAIASGKAICACAAGYYAENLECVPNQIGTDAGGTDAGGTDSGGTDAGGTDPCYGVTCSNHGTCASVGGKAACGCDSGYHADGLACVPDSATAFKVFDSLELSGKPDGLDAQYGLLRMTQHNEDQGWWAGAPGGQGASVPAQDVFDAAIASANDVIPFSSDGYLRLSITFHPRISGHHRKADVG